MKFGYKLTLALLGVLALVLSLSTVWTQERQFDRALSDLRRTAQAEWQRESQDFQNGLRTDTETPLGSRAWSYLGGMARQGSTALLAVYDEKGQSLASTMPATLAQSELTRNLPDDGALQCRIVTGTDGTRYLLCSGLLILPEQCLTFISAQSLASLLPIVPCGCGTPCWVRAWRWWWPRCWYCCSAAGWSGRWSGWTGSAGKSPPAPTTGAPACPAATKLPG